MTSGLRHLSASSLTEEAALPAHDRRKSPRPRDRSRNQMATDSDGSVDTNSSQDSNAGADPPNKSSADNTASNTGNAGIGPNSAGGGGTGLSKRTSNRSCEWEIIEGLKDGQRYDRKPEPFSGYLHKKRKWPLKGWHKRFFVVDKGILVYGKSPSEVNRGKLHGSLDIGLSVISAKLKEKRLHIDAEEFIYHLKAKQQDAFVEWVEQLKRHRLYRQHVLSYGGGGLHRQSSTGGSRQRLHKQETVGSKQLQGQDQQQQAIAGSDASGGQPSKIPLSRKMATEGGGRPVVGSGLGGSGSGSGGQHRVQWLVDSAPLQAVTTELNHTQQALNQLSRILDRLESSAADSESCCAQEGFSPNVKKDRKKFGLRKKKSAGGRMYCGSAGSSLELSGAAVAVATVAAVAGSPPAAAANSCGVATAPAPPSPAVTMVSPPQTVPTTVSIDNDSGSPISLSSGLTSSASPSPSRPQSLPPSLHQTTDHGHHLPAPTQPLSAPYLAQDNLQLASDFIILAKDIYSSLKAILFAEITERDNLKKSLSDDACGGGCCAVALQSARSTLQQALQQNTELRARLAAVHQHSNLADITDNVKTLQSSLSYSSSCVSGSEFYDAEDSFQHDDDEGLDAESAGGGGGGVEAVDGGGVAPGRGATTGGGGRSRPPGRAATTSDTSSIAASVSSEEEGSASSEASDLGDSEYNPTQNLGGGGGSRNLTGRRSKLPVPRPSTEGLSLWNLLTKNIGKDLSQVSMPVALNEPLNMLQRMCEELEYSELLDKASELSDPYERMVYVAAFAVSSYGSSYFRAGSKPFNPLLGETYECIREDKGFRFISEQVSHHPPVSVCFAESRNFVFWQDIRIKTKFWGKSMEFQPTGYVNVKLERPGGDGADVYRWNKVTTCVHNLFSAQRWVDQYGELTIVASPSGGGQHTMTCKLTFVKASYWSAKRHEITGVIVDEREGRVVRNLFGKWSEAFYCGVAPSAKCIWRPGTMPEDYELYYGFTRFAMELNELDEDMAKYLPLTDTRFRPDQRLLEEGKLEEAEAAKLQLEQAQRERRKRYEMENRQHVPRWFRKMVMADGTETWEYVHKYWETRKSPGFVNLSFEPLW